MCSSSKECNQGCSPRWAKRLSDDSILFVPVDLFAAGQVLESGQGRIKGGFNPTNTAWQNKEHHLRRDHEDWQFIGQS